MTYFNFLVADITYNIAPWCDLDLETTKHWRIFTFCTNFVVAILNMKTRSNCRRHIFENIFGNIKTMDPYELIFNKIAFPKLCLG